jgi:hypothetical protein
MTQREWADESSDVLQPIKRQVQRWRHWFADRHRSSRAPLRYELTRDGFKVLDNRRSKLLAMLRWPEVRAIQAYSRDVFACYYSGHYLLNIQQMDWNEESRWVRA